MRVENKLAPPQVFALATLRFRRGRTAPFGETKRQENFEITFALTRRLLHSKTANFHHRSEIRGDAPVGRGSRSCVSMWGFAVPRVRHELGVRASFFCRPAAQVQLVPCSTCGIAMQGTEKQFNIRRHFARQFKTWRLSQNLPLKVVAADLGISKAALCQWESGVNFPSPEKMALLSDYTSLPLCHFMCAVSKQSACRSNHHRVN